MADAETLAALWQRMTDLFPNRWTVAVGEFAPDSMAVKTWAAALSGVDGESIKAGLRAMVRAGDAFPPSAPQFRKYCLDGEEIPNEADAMREAARAASAGGINWASHAWSHPVVYRTASNIGTYVMCHYTDFALRALWRDEYRATLARWRAGDRFTCPEPKRLEKPKLTPCKPETAARHIAAIRELLNDPEPVTEEPTDAT